MLVPSSVPLKDDHGEHDYEPFSKKLIGTSVPINVKGDALMLGSDIHTQLRWEAA